MVNSTAKNLIKNTTYLVGASIAAKALSFLFFLYAARYLGVGDFGLFSYAIALSGSFAVFFEFGVDVFIVREVARKKEETGKYLVNMLALRIFSAALLFLAIAVFLAITRQTAPTRAAVYMMTISMALNYFTLLFFSALRAHEIMGYEALYNILSSALLLLGGFILMAKGSGVFGYTVIYVFTSIVFLLYAIAVCVRKFGWNRLEIDVGFIKESFKEAWPMGVMAIFIMIYFRTDVVMLSLMKGNAAVGIYGVSYRISESITIIPSMLLYALFPIASRYHEESKLRFGGLYEKTCKFLVILAFPIGLMLTLLAKQLIAMLYGVEYGESAGCLQVLIWAAAVMFLTMVLGNALVAANRQRFTMYFAMLSAVLNIGLNALLIPRYSYIGASIATLVTESLGVVFGFTILRRFGYRLNLGDIFLAPVAAMAISLSIMSVLLATGVNIYITALSSLASYIVVVVLVGFKEDDRSVVRQTIRSFRSSRKG